MISFIKYLWEEIISYYWQKLETTVVLGGTAAYGYIRWAKVTADIIDVLIGLAVLIGLGAKAYKEIHSVLVARRKESERLDRLDDE